MTTLSEFHALQRGVEYASKNGLVLKYDASRRGIAVQPQATHWPGVADDVTVFRADSLEEALLWIAGALWTRDFLNRT